MKKIGLLMFVLTACTLAPINKEVQPPTESAVKAKIPELVTVQASVQPGKVKFVQFEAPLSNGRHYLDCGATEKLPVMVQDYVAQVYLAESYFSSRKSFQCYISGNRKTALLNVSVIPFNYPEEKLMVDQKKVELSKRDLERVAREREITEKIYQNSASNFLFNEGFAVPLKSFVTSHYGTRRLFNNKKSSQHLGNDFRAAIGVPIPVSNDGKVVFVGDLFFTGLVVIVDHGMDIFTMYGHLSKIQVKDGEMLKKGQIVGLSGATGRVSGPHLHWGVKINGHWVDGFSLTEQGKDLAVR